MENAENRAKLYAKITDLANEIGAVKEDETNDHDHYAFISYQKMNAMLRQLLPKYKLAIVPNVDSYEERDYTTQSGKASIRSVVRMTFMLIDTETGYAEERTFIGGDQDTKGKSLGQAITECQKRFEMKLFHVSSKEADPDSKSVEHAPKSKMSWGQLLNALDNAFYEHGADGMFKQQIESAGYSVEDAYALKEKDLQKELYTKLNNSLKKLEGK